VTAIATNIKNKTVIGILPPQW